MEYARQHTLHTPGWQALAGRAGVPGRASPGGGARDARHLAHVVLLGALLAHILLACTFMRMGIYCPVLPPTTRQC